MVLFLPQMSNGLEGSSGVEGQRNNILQKAIMLYVGEVNSDTYVIFLPKMVASFST